MSLKEVHSYFSRKNNLVLHHLGKNVSLKAKKIVLVGGCFDILHFGHLEFLKYARSQGDHLVVALEPDARILQKRSIVIHTQKQRGMILAPYVDTIIMIDKLYNQHDYQQLTKDVMPHVIAITKGDPKTTEKNYCALSVKAELIPVTCRINPFSTARILSLLNKKL